MSFKSDLSVCQCEGAKEKDWDVLSSLLVTNLGSQKTKSNSKTILYPRAFHSRQCSSTAQLQETSWNIPIRGLLGKDRTMQLGRYIKEHPTPLARPFTVIFFGTTGLFSSFGKGMMIAICKLVFFPLHSHRETCFS